MKAAIAELGALARWLIDPANHPMSAEGLELQLMRILGIANIPKLARARSGDAGLQYSAR